MATPQLKWSDFQGREKAFQLAATPVLLGRHSDCDITFADPYVSRRHARVVPERDAHFLVDLQSTHGTFVNGERITNHKLKSGDRITLGRGSSALLFTADAGHGDQQDTTWDSSVENSILELAAAHPAYADYSDLEKISLLLDFQYALDRNFSAQRTFQQILASALKVSGAERGFILLRNGHDFSYVVGMNSRGEALQHSEFVQASQTVVNQVAETGEAVSMTEGISGDLAQQDSIVAMGVRALSCTPLHWFGGDSDSSIVRGILYLDSTKAMHALSGLDQKILDKLADEAAAVFEKVEMIEAFEERKRIDQELALAQETQQHLLPVALPQLPGFHVLAFSQPTHHVGGDFFDFFKYSDGGLTAALADVSGKGISAALLSALTQGALSAELKPDIDPEESLQRVNQFLCRRSASNRFVTLFFFHLEEDGRGLYINAGHNPAFVLQARNGQVTALEPHSMIVGAFATATFKAMPLELEPADVLVVYSDGLTEAENPSGRMFGEERLRDLILDFGAQGAAQLNEEIKSAIANFTEGHPQTDDITLMLVEKVS